MKTTLSILIIVKSLPWRFKGGIQTHSWDLARALQAKGHQVTILTGGAFLKGQVQNDHEGISVLEIPFFPGRYLPAISFLAEELAFNLRVKSWVKKNHQRYDIIHTQGRSGYLLYQLPQVHHKLIQTIHGHTGTEAASDLHNLNAKIHSFFAQKWETKTLSIARRTIAVSQDLKRSVERSHQVGSEAISVIPNGVGGNESHPNLPTEKRVKRFVFVGRLHPVKGLVPLIKEIAEAPQPLFLDIIGEGPQWKELEELILDLGLSRQVRMLGAYPNAAIQMLLPHYQGLILPSVYESQGIVLLEANLCGIPVIASDLPSIQESVLNRKNGILCPIDRPEEFIKAMEYLQENPREAKKMGLMGQSWVKENFNWSKIADQTIDLYHQLAS
ncbi:glycosyltransferase family 4 protein [Algoriphagus taiwanensis]|uniref:Glycosyltransferase family 4 protein n=1 Tax=Algoriphagus taiwanensis TaxID=1445656 RepID=A0ABQ6Q155_9BACT|nr:glycosyltransferase family 4 protein [Algoriphagus taiwanensis]